MNSSLCIFKKDSSSGFEEFAPGDIKLYQLTDGKLYVSKQLPSNYEGQNALVFLECLIQGKISLFMYNSSIGLQYFIETPNDVLHELHNTQKTIVEHGTAYNTERREYVGELKYYLSDCPEIGPLIYKTRFDRRSLVDLIRNYQRKTCDNNLSVAFDKNDDKLKITCSGIISYWYSNVYVNDGDPEFLLPTKSAGYGVMIELSGIPDLSKKLSLRTGVNYFNNKYYIDTSLPYPYNLFPDPFIYHIRVFRFPLSFRYAFTTSFIKPYLEIGGALNGRDVVKRLNIIQIQAIHPVQFSGFANVGIAVSLKNKLKMDLGYSFERAFRFYGSPDDKSYCNNHIFSFSIGHPF